MEALNSIAGKIDEKVMSAMNKSVLIDKESEIDVARKFLGIAEPSGKKETYINEFLKRLIDRSIEHLFLVLVSVFIAGLIGTFLGIISYKYARVGQFILAVVAVFQTIPSLAMLVVMIPFFGIGTKRFEIAFMCHARSQSVVCMGRAD